MSRFNAVRVLFILKIFSQLFNEIVSDKHILKTTTVAKHRGLLPSKDYLEIKLIEDLAEVTGDESTCGVRIRTISHRNMSTILYCVERGIIDSGTTGIFYAHYRKQAYHKVAYLPHPEIFDRLDVDFYQNSKVGAALAIFEDSQGIKSIIGVIDGEYIAKSMPMEQWDLITNFSSSDTDYDEDDSSETNSDEDDDSDEESQLGISKPTEKPQENSIRSNAKTTDQCDTDYPKLLISADYASVQKYENVDDFLMELMGYFNVVDMMYRQFDDPKIRLKITGIIIPQDELATPYVAQSKSTTGKLNGAKLMKSAIEYFNWDGHRFPAHNRDVVMVMVNNRFTDSPIKKSSHLAYWDQESGILHDTVGRVAAVKYDATLDGIIRFADTLSRSFEVDSHSVFGRGPCDIDSTHLSVNPTNAGKPIQWDPCVHDHLEDFMKLHEEMCFHHEPKEFSYALSILPGAWMNGDGQCKNKHVLSTGSCLVEDNCQHHGCRVNYRCVRLNEPPMPGTLLRDGRRCINGKSSNSTS